MNNDYIFDIETYPNVFTLAAEHADSGLKWAFEISDWKNESKDIIEFLTFLKNTDARMVGFNNIAFDYPVIHTLVRMGKSDAATLYAKAQAIISAQDDDKWTHNVKESDRYVQQIDLFKIHHFDNKARSTSLKALEFNMRADSIQDLPFKVGTVLTRDQADDLKKYNTHDVTMTKKFYLESLKMIGFREELTRKYNRDFLNHNDTKIGKDYFIMRLEEAGVECYKYGSNGRTPAQTLRPSIALKDAILPWITFQNFEFNRVLGWLKQQTITETKGVFDNLTATVNGFTFVFGLGGIHGSVENEIIESDDDYAIVDLDVSSYYPNLAITNGFYPEHLGKEFCGIYKGLYEQRKSYPKGSAENAMLKLALNGTYGDSNNKFSVFYDPLFTMKITLNGQLLLCLLADQILTDTKAEIIQVNTDGVTVRIPRVEMEDLEGVRWKWEKLTGLQLEQVLYSKMMIRDVNNYLAVYENGKVKRKGAYEYDMEWHQDASALVVAKATEKVLTTDAPIRKTIEEWSDIMDFMLRVKVQRTGYLSIADHADGDHIQVQNTTRYYVAKGGPSLFKWLPPLNKPDWRRFALQKGWGVQVCNDIKDISLPIDFEYYIQETEKLCLAMT